MKDFSLFLSGKVEFVSDTECNQSYGIDGVSIGLLCAAFNGMMGARCARRTCPRRGVVAARGLAKGRSGHNAKQNKVC